MYVRCSKSRVEHDSVSVGRPARVSLQGMLMTATSRILDSSDVENYMIF